jgi:membrane protein required for colicin V production
MDMIAFHPYDLFVVILLALTTLFGAWKGIAWQLASIASLVVSYVVALKYSAQLAPHISADAPWNRFLAMLVLFAATALAVWLLFGVLARFIERVHLKEFDRQMGALFGLGTGVLLALVVTFFAVTLSEKGRSAVLRSRSGYAMARLIRRAEPVIPPEVDAVLGEYLDRLQNELEPADPLSPADEPGVAPLAEASAGR